MRSTMISAEDPPQKPWLSAKSTRESLSYWLTYGVMSLGLVAGALHPLCIVLDEEFNNPDTVFGTGINGNGGDGTGTFIREVDMSGFGNGEFEMATDSSNNSYVKDGYLYIVPTLTSNVLPLSSILNNTVYNITGCTYNISTSYTQATTDADSGTTFDQKAYLEACSAVSNATAGTVINPVQSARLTTMGSSSIRYGRVEVKAKMPKGDWVRYALPILTLCLLTWICSFGGNMDATMKTYSYFTQRRKTPTFMRMYVDSRLKSLLFLKLNKPFFERGDFPSVVQNGSQSEMLQNPWVNGTNATPFDQEFYLILNVAVGGTNGWFPDGQGNKPWIDASDNHSSEESFLVHGSFQSDSAANFSILTHPENLLPPSSNVYK
ncbi:concanavalin A-like lectin/glucanase [Gymnopus androsaceus JB14]|uniref:Concanavalin A-like lectin/glucanase n=1 Tax=Gymnopus androsaceus JB14 TaxID=1447944 RepID=A0A6A4HVQ2_9AGAR|nr:concanavalin A-like lectin/glucanase [Gymnopus androsaceus JB14]